MNILAPLIIITVLLVALYFCEWQVVLAFTLAVLVLPFTLLFLTHLYEVIIQGKQMDFNSAFEIGALFSIAGIFIYFPFILPIYYALKSANNFPILYSFPLSVSIVLFILFILMATKPWGFKEFLVVVGCSMLHALFILWLISKFKSLSF